MRRSSPGEAAIKNGKYKDPNTKKTIDISGEYRFLDVYARRNGKWQVVASQATKTLQLLHNSVSRSSTAASPISDVISVSFRSRFRELWWSTSGSGLRS